MKSVVIGTAGHIDHGKSALVQALTGIDPDRLQEEKARGITIDLGFAHAEIDAVTFAFVDVPGHERFVKNLLAGVGGIDSVLFVIAADESVMPQTREHFAICRLLRIPAGLIALTKADLVDRDTLDLVRLEARELVAGSFLASAPILSVSSKTGEGLPELRDALVALAGTLRGRSSGGAARLPIDRVFSMKGFGTVVTGTLVSGRIGVDDELALLPADRRVKVRGVQVHGVREAAALAGRRVALNLGGIETADVVRGDVLVTPESLAPGRVVDAVLELLPDSKPLRHGARIRFHQGTSELLGRVALAGPIERSDRERAVEIQPGTSAYVRLRLEAPAVLTRGDRFIVRAYSPTMTIAGGQVLDPHPPRTPIRTALGRARFERLNPAAGIRDEVNHDLALQAMIAEAGPLGLAIQALASRGGVPLDQIGETIERLGRLGHALRIGETLVAPSVVQDLKQRLLKALAEYHRAQPLSEGLPREEARHRLFSRADPAVFEFVVAELLREGAMTAKERLALSSHRVELSEDEARARATIEAVFRQAALKPPDMATLAAEHRIPSAVAERMVGLLVRHKVLVRVDTLLFHHEALQQLKAEIGSLRGQAGGIDVGTFKERYGITRKFAIPLLEYLDRERITRRVGEKRIVI